MTRYHRQIGFFDERRTVMFRRILFPSIGGLALVVLGPPGQLHAAPMMRGGFSHGGHMGFHGGIMPGFHGGFMPGFSGGFGMPFGTRFGEPFGTRFDRGF